MVLELFTKAQKANQTALCLQAEEAPRGRVRVYSQPGKSCGPGKIIRDFCERLEYASQRTTEGVSGVLDMGEPMVSHSPDIDDSALSCDNLSCKLHLTSVKVN